MRTASRRWINDTEWIQTRIEHSNSSLHSQRLVYRDAPRALHCLLAERGLSQTHFPHSRPATRGAFPFLGY
jgi:hypothetical protein